MINVDYEELLKNLVYIGIDPVKYSSIVARIIAITDPVVDEDGALELLITNNCEVADRYILQKIGSDNYTAITALDPVTDAIQISDLKLCETYLTLMNLKNLESLQLDDNFQNQSDDYISLSKSNGGLLVVSRLRRDADRILREWYCANE